MKYYIVSQVILISTCVLYIIVIDFEQLLKKLTLIQCRRSYM